MISSGNWPSIWQNFTIFDWLDSFSTLLIELSSIKEHLTLAQFNEEVTTIEFYTKYLVNLYHNNQYHSISDDNDDIIYEWVDYVIFDKFHSEEERETREKMYSIYIYINNLILIHI